MESAGFKIPLTIRASEKSAVIRVFFHLDDERASKLCVREDDGNGSPLRDVRKRLLQSARDGDILVGSVRRPMQGSVQLTCV